MAKNKKKKSSGMAAALWLLAFLILSVAFLAKKDVIIENLKSANFFERVFNKKAPKFIENHESQTLPQKKDDEVVITPLPEESSPNFPQESKESEKNLSSHTEKSSENQNLFPKTKENPLNAQQNQEKNPPKNQDPPKTQKPEQKKSQEVQTPPKNAQKSEQNATQILKATLYFIQIDSDGRVDLKNVPRSLSKSDSPLTDVIKSLLSGPSYEEKTKGAMTLIPEQTRLISATVKNGTAFLNFSEEFQFNTLGIEGYIGQLKQIVYTATTFSTVSSVQFLIEGQKYEYLGSEGVWIGTPLTRKNF